ncbi:hypothetical protein Q427_05600 [Halomonas sp. BC04]|nr:hypothetical protein Q427_05600 [Halomonas sp. BC04]
MLPRIGVIAASLTRDIDQVTDDVSPIGSLDAEHVRAFPIGHGGSDYIEAVKMVDEYVVVAFEANGSHDGGGLLLALGIAEAAVKQYWLDSRAGAFHHVTHARLASLDEQLALAFKGVMAALDAGVGVQGHQSGSGQ